MTTVFHLEKLKYLVCAQKYTMTFSNQFGELDTFEDPVELGDTFKHETLQVAKECTGERPRSWSDLA